MNRKITFIGAGNLATHLARAFFHKGYVINRVYSRTIESAKNLAAQINCAYTNDSKEIGEADIYFVATKDSAIQEVLSKVSTRNKLIVHCSGSTPLSVLLNYSENVGVFYPLQTFSKHRPVDFKSIPVFVEANTIENQNILLEMAHSISENAVVLDSEKRKLLHISAVFACNFVNHFYTLASEILEKGDLSFEVLKPLILETAQKVQELSPLEAQTGPAVRYDEDIINKHLQELKNLKNHTELYKSISKSIFDHHKKIE